MPKIADDIGARVMAYECPVVMDALLAALRQQCSAGEWVIWREAFRWKDHNGVLPNQYEMFSLDTVASNIRCEVVWDFNHAAIVRTTPAPPSSPARDK
jgi:hypothetical protein